MSFFFIKDKNVKSIIHEMRNGYNFILDDGELDSSPIRIEFPENCIILKSMDNIFSFKVLKYHETQQLSLIERISIWNAFKAAMSRLSYARAFNREASYYVTQ